MTTDTNGVGFGSVASRIRTASGATLAVLLIAYLYTVVTAPIDATQGVIQKILYVHVPLAYGAYLGFVVTAVSGALYLWKADEKWDRLAVAGAEVGVIFCTLMLVTGPIWARGTWGKWWSW
ncbi:MAG: cytochrome c biogenesis protein CcsA, partial [Myxococcota bacterium]|nr:cytochrome c biogenesis protein CcsA [Myxococcota bacterium]